MTENIDNKMLKKSTIFGIEIKGDTNWNLHLGIPIQMQNRNHFHDQYNFADLQNFLIVKNSIV